MNIQQEVKLYYGKVLQKTDDLQTNACCTNEPMPAHIKTVLEKIHPEVQSRYYGCGLIAPEALTGCRILDLGCGSGRDVYLLSALVGESGQVVGVDMTTEQLAVARRHVEYHQQQFGHAQSNVRFLQGELEKLDSLDLPQGHFDVIVSNCVLNLVTDKPAVLRHAWHLLKEGGEFYFSDVYADRRIPKNLQQDPVLYGECLSGALYWNDFLHLAKAAGFADPRLVDDRPITLNNPEQEAKLGNIRFYSATYRLMKIESLEPACEDYGQAVRYRGNMPYHPYHFILDKHHILETGRLSNVCGNSFRMLKNSRFAPYFEFFGDFSTHYGIFPECGSQIPFTTNPPQNTQTHNACC